MKLQNQNSRRMFFGWLSAVIPATYLAARQVHAAEPKGGDKGGDKKKPYQGTSKKGNIQEALDDAIANALKSAPGADRQVKWSFKEMTGTEGGITGLNELTVTIDAVIT